MIYSLIRAIINTVNAAPRVILMIAVTFFFVSIACGMMGWLALSNFFNLFMLFFLSIAVLVALLGLAKWAVWRNSGFRQTRSDGTVALILRHILDVQTRERYLLNARETRYTFVRQPVLVASLPTESRLVPLTCSTCQQELIMRVHSLQERQRTRLRSALFSTLGLALMIAIELGIYLITNGQGDRYHPLGYAHIASIVLLFISMFGFLRLFKYVGITLIKAPPGHDLVHPASLKELRMQASAQAQR